MGKIVFITNVVQPWKISKEGKLKAPATIIREGVLCGSAGCILHEGKILKQYADKWKDVPIVIDHPSVNGQYVSVNYSNETRSKIIGKTTLPRYDEETKSIIVMIEISNYSNISELQNIKEVSVGAFSEYVTKSGNFRGKNYKAISTTLVPDHLALLPFDKGACSWADGCGIRTNSYKKESDLLYPNGVTVKDQKENTEKDLLFPNGVRPIKRNYANEDREIELLLPIGIKKPCFDCD